jgi:hypothetical protein
VRTADGQEFPALVGRQPSRLTIRLITATSLLGYKARVVLPGPDGGDFVVGPVHVVWTVRRPDTFFENGATLLDAGTGEPQRAPEGTRRPVSQFD